jgi:hypothetical protein
MHRDNNNNNGSAFLLIISISAQQHDDVNYEKSKELCFGAKRE